MDVLGLVSSLLAIAAIIVQMVEIHQLKEKLKGAIVLGAALKQYYKDTYDKEAPEFDELTPFIRQAEFGYEMAKKQKKVTL